MVLNVKNINKYCLFFTCSCYKIYCADDTLINLNDEDLEEVLCSYKNDEIKKKIGCDPNLKFIIGQDTNWKSIKIESVKLPKYLHNIFLEDKRKIEDELKKKGTSEFHGLKLIYFSSIDNTYCIDFSFKYNFIEFFVSGTKDYEASKLLSIIALKTLTTDNFNAYMRDNSFKYLNPDVLKAFKNKPYVKSISYTNNKPTYLKVELDVDKLIDTLEFDMCFSNDIEYSIDNLEELRKQFSEYCKKKLLNNKSKIFEKLDDFTDSINNQEEFFLFAFGLEFEREKFIFDFTDDKNYIKYVYKEKKKTSFTDYYKFESSAKLYPTYYFSPIFYHIWKNEIISDSKLMSKEDQDKVVDAIFTKDFSDNFIKVLNSINLDKLNLYSKYFQNLINVLDRFIFKIRTKLNEELLKLSISNIINFKEDKYDDDSKIRKSILNKTIEIYKNNEYFKSYKTLIYNDGEKYKYILKKNINENNIENLLGNTNINDLKAKIKEKLNNLFDFCVNKIYTKTVWGKYDLDKDLIQQFKDILKNNKEDNIDLSDEYIENFNFSERVYEFIDKFIKRYEEKNCEKLNKDGLINYLYQNFRYLSFDNFL